MFIKEEGFNLEMLHFLMCASRKFPNLRETCTVCWKTILFRHESFTDDVLRALQTTCHSALTISKYYQMTVMPFFIEFFSAVSNNF